MSDLGQRITACPIDYMHQLEPPMSGCRRAHLMSTRLIFFFASSSQKAFPMPSVQPVTTAQLPYLRPRVYEINSQRFRLVELITRNFTHLRRFFPGRMKIRQTAERIVRRTRATWGIERSARGC